jgi:hypothetical protein
MKGCSANSIGDGPSQIDRTMCLLNCGIYAVIPLGHQLPIIAYASDNSKVGMRLREINGIDLLMCRLNQEEIINLLLSPNEITYQLISPDGIPFTYRSSSSSTSNLLHVNHEQHSQNRNSLYNNIGIVAKIANRLRSNIHKHAIIMKASNDFIERTGFNEGDIIYKINHTETSDFTDDELQEKLSQFSDDHSYIFLKSDKYKKIMKRIHGFASIKQQWDYERPCRYCGCLYLRNINPSGRKQCCLNGMALHSIEFPNIGDFPPEIAFLTYERLQHMSSKSSYYNGVLSLGATAIDNGTGGGWEKIVGDHAVKLHGR